MTGAWTEVSRTADSRIAQDRALVLEALDIGSGSAFASGEHVLLVRVEDAERARAELEKYARENQVRPLADETPQPIERSAAAAAAYILVLLAFDLAQRRGIFGLDWRSAGVASADLIRHGEWWRGITALSLHANGLHLASNLAFGALFGIMLAQSVGFGLAWLLFVATGFIGNTLNAWLQSPSHASIGASTAVFGMLGVQAAHDWVRRRALHGNLFRRWAPLAIGAAVLAWLGGDGRQVDPNAYPGSFGDLNAALPRIDVWAHVLGFGAGLGLGGLVGWGKSRFRPTAKSQAAFAVIAGGLVAAAWAFALR